MSNQDLIHSKESGYFIICLLISILIYIALIVSIVGLIYMILISIAVFFVEGLLMGRIRGNAVRVTESQFPKLHQMVVNLSREMGLEKTPAVYVQQNGGILNAFATRFLRRDFVVVYSDVLELALREGDDALAFVVAHELGHVARKHMSKRIWIYPALFMPFLGTAYYRACEYTADRFGARYAPSGGSKGLLVLAAGKHLYKEVDGVQFSKQADEESGFFVWLAEKLETHPNLTKRVKALEAFSQPVS
jgi:Zn-dependent protease with chaperone function